MRAVPTTFLFFLGATLLLPATLAPAGLRTTVNAAHALNRVPNWAPATMCVDLRGQGTCNLITAPELCRSTQDDPVLRPAFWAALDAAKTPNSSLMIGTYLSGARVQHTWRDWPIDAIDIEELDDHTGWDEEDWLDPQTNYPDLVNIDDADARAAFAAEIIEESNDRRSAAVAEDLSLEILYLDNVAHPCFASATANHYTWASRTALLSAVRTGISPTKLIANVAIAPHYFDCPEVTEDELQDLIA